MTATTTLGWTVLLDWLPPAALSPNARSRWGRIRATRQTREAVWAAVLAAGWPRQDANGPRRRLTIAMTRARLLDPDNAYAMVVPLVNGVRRAGALHDDSERYVELVVRQERGKPSRTVLRLEEMLGEER